MYRTPPPDDQQPDYPQTPTIYPRQRRRRSITPRQLPSHYLSDEAPEIPIAKRASLYRDRQKAQPLPAEVETETEAAEETTDENGHESEADLPAYPPESRKIMLTQRRRSPVYEPPSSPPAHRTRPTYSQRYLPAQLSRLSHHPGMLITCLFLLALLIIGPIAFYAIRPQIRITANSTVTTVTSSSSLQVPTNPHELVITPQDSDHPAPPVYATAAYLLDADTGATLYAHNPFMHLPVLSTTKLMTAVLAAEQGNPDQEITITPAIDQDVSQLSADSALFGLKKGETYTLRDLLYGLLLVSGNDAAIAIADTLGGNLPHFVAEMNQRAQQLELYDTHYMNPHGLLETGQYSSAHDLAILGRYAFSLPLIHQISGTQQYDITKTASHAEHYLVNGNQFLWWYLGVDSGKTGYDGQYDFVQVMSCTHNHHHLIGVVIHTVNWWTDMRDLMNWGFDSFQWISPYDVDFQHPIPYDFLWNYFTGDKKENTIPTPDQGRYYVYTGFSVSGPILTYFDSGGGLKKFGYPESMATVSSTLLITQTFEHATIQCDLTTKQCNTA